MEAVEKLINGFLKNTLKKQNSQAEMKGSDKFYDPKFSIESTNVLECNKEQIEKDYENAFALPDQEINDSLDKVIKQVLIKLIENFHKDAVGASLMHLNLELINDDNNKKWDLTELQEISTCINETGCQFNVKIDFQYKIIQKQDNNVIKTNAINAVNVGINAINHVCEWFNFKNIPIIPHEKKDKEQAFGHWAFVSTKDDGYPAAFRVNIVMQGQETFTVKIAIDEMKLFGKLKLVHNVDMNGIQILKGKINTFKSQFGRFISLVFQPLLNYLVGKKITNVINTQKVEAKSLCEKPEQCMEKKYEYKDLRLQQYQAETSNSINVMMGVFKDTYYQVGTQNKYKLPTKLENILIILKAESLYDIINKVIVEKIYPLIKNNDNFGKNYAITLLDQIKKDSILKISTKKVKLNERKAIQLTGSFGLTQKNQPNCHLKFSLPIFINEQNKIMLIDDFKLEFKKEKLDNMNFMLKGVLNLAIKLFKSKIKELVNDSINSINNTIIFGQKLEFVDFTINEDKELETRLAFVEA